jgi:adenosylcobinamide-phosphate synthase
MDGEMALQPASILTPDAFVLAAAVALDLAIGDPVYGAHPVRLIGRTLQAIESILRRIGADGYAGGVALFVALSVLWVGGLSLALLVLFRVHPWLGWALHLVLLYSLLALGDLLVHGRRIEWALGRGDLEAAKAAVSQLVGRDTDRMDDAACRRAAVESLSENLTDGFTSPLFWYAVGGVPGLVLFKVVSTMDSMVGYTTPRYLRFGWCGARLDDVMNYVPARLTFALLAVVAAVVPWCSGRKALVVGLSQHAFLPGPNSGWSEAATAGAVQRRLVGPIWMNGQQVTTVWLGDAGDPPLATADDYRRASAFIAFSGATAAFAACFICWLRASVHE